MSFLDIVKNAPFFSSDGNEEFIPSLTYKSIHLSSALARRKLEEERFSASGAEKEKMFEIL